MPAVPAQVAPIAEPIPEARPEERIIYRNEPAPVREEIISTITAINTALNGRKVFLLENGERWQETRNYGLRFEIGAEVFLKKGYLSGYNMTSGRNTIRVARVD